MAQTWQARSEKENFCAPYIKPICFHGDWSEFTDDFIRELMIYYKYDSETHISCKSEGTWKPKKKRHGKENEVIHGNVTVSEKENSRNLIDRNETTAENEQNVIVDEVENNKELSEVEQESSEVAKVK